MNYSSNSNIFDGQVEECKICGEQSESIGLYYGVVTCQACKKFFWRSRDSESSKYKCPGQMQCTITIGTRQSCRYCRFQKCLTLGMDLKILSSELNTSDMVNKCTICSQVASGVHFGVLSCEGCKGFFRRSRLNNKAATYECKITGQISVNPCPLNLFNCCRFCRYQKCLQVGMSYASSKTGRHSNLRKKQILMARSQPVKSQLQEAHLGEHKPAKRARFEECEASLVPCTSGTGSSNYQWHSTDLRFVQRPEVYQWDYTAQYIPQNPHNQYQRVSAQYSYHYNSMFDNFTHSCYDRCF